MKVEALEWSKKVVGEAQNQGEIGAEPLKGTHDIIPLVGGLRLSGLLLEPPLEYVMSGRVQRPILRDASVWLWYYIRELLLGLKEFIVLSYQRWVINEAILQGD